MPKEQTLRVALVAWEIESSTQTDNLKRAERIARNAVEQGAQAIGFTEYFSILGTGTDFVDSAKKPGEGAVTQWAERVATENNLELWCPFVELGDDGRKYNSVAIVDPTDGLVGTAREFHYLALDKMGMSVGREIRVFNRPWGKLGCVVCFNIHFAEAARVLSLQGAEVVVADTGRRPGVQIVDMDLTRGSYGSGVLRLGENTQCDNLRQGFQQCLRADYYARAYQKLAHRGS